MIYLVSTLYVGNSMDVIVWFESNRTQNTLMVHAYGEQRLLTACAGAVAAGGIGRHGQNPGGNKGPVDADDPTVAGPNPRVFATASVLRVTRAMEEMGDVVNAPVALPSAWSGARGENPRTGVKKTPTRHD